MTDLPLWRVTYENAHTENAVSILRTVYVRATERNLKSAFRKRVRLKHMRMVEAEKVA